MRSIKDAELQQKDDVLSGIKEMLPVMFDCPASGNEWEIRENVDCNGNSVKSDGISSVGVFCNGRFICSASVNGDSPACLAFDAMRCIERAVDII